MITELNELPTTDRDTIEMLIDKHGIRGVIAALATIAGEKADHVNANFADSSLTADWLYVMSACNRA